MHPIPAPRWVLHQCLPNTGKLHPSLMPTPDHAIPLWSARGPFMKEQGHLVQIHSTGCDICVTFQEQQHIGTNYAMQS